MKNKFFIIFFLVLLNLTELTTAEEFVFEVSNLEITENGDIYKGKDRGKIVSNSQLELLSDNFEYIKKNNELKLNGNVKIFDVKNDITIDAETIFYFKNKEKISTLGKTLIKISDKYIIEGFDLTLLKNEMLLSSQKNTSITDKDSNRYKLDEFNYYINQEILNGKNIEVSTNKDNKKNSDTIFIKT